MEINIKEGCGTIVSNSGRTATGIGNTTITNVTMDQIYKMDQVDQYNNLKGEEFILPQIPKNNFKNFINRTLRKVFQYFKNPQPIKL